MAAVLLILFVPTAFWLGLGAAVSAVLCAARLSLL